MCRSAIRASPSQPAACDVSDVASLQSAIARDMPYNASLLRVACSITLPADPATAAGGSSSSGRRQLLLGAGAGGRAESHACGQQSLCNAVSDPGAVESPYPAAVATAVAAVGSSSGQGSWTASRRLLQATTTAAPPAAAATASSLADELAAATAADGGSSGSPPPPPPPGTALGCGAELQLNVTLVVEVAGGATSASAAAAAAAGGGQQELLQPLHDLADRLLRVRAFVCACVVAQGARRWRRRRDSTHVLGRGLLLVAATGLTHALDK